MNKYWEKYQIIDIEKENIDEIKIKISGNIICVYLNKKIIIIERMKEGIWEKTKILNEINNFSLYENRLIFMKNESNNIFIYEKDIDWNEIQNIKLDFDINKILLYNNYFFISHSKGIDIYERDTLGNWGKLQSINILLTNFISNGEMLILINMRSKIDSLIKFDMNEYDVDMLIYEKKNNNKFEYLKSKKMIDTKNNINHNLSINKNNILISHYLTEELENINKIEIIEKNIENIKWKGEIIYSFNKIDFYINGDYCSDNNIPSIELSWLNINLLKMKENFYYKNIPDITIKIFDINKNSYKDDIKIKNIIFDYNYLKFSLDKIEELPYHYIFYIHISYLIQ
jgi:hypothetical protein